MKPQLRVPRSVWAVSIALGLTGCFGWGPYEAAAPLSDSPGLPYRLRATLADSHRVELGLLGALLANRLLSAMLYEVTPTDVARFAAVTGFLLGVATLAILIPAQATTRIDPVIVLRAEG